ncbi:LysR family transcriptional regulator [Tanticharoenia sakaeratensis]|uniref:LysR family transcriptional regulator n=1 Tax=Tanticharoenia sakaeratensis NBRC 103193 TaxID=1231623 RepID=A0A0D6MHL8_9PROT|nr:LysR family transcriptional regulator [Tanticharoenia sakaeratensis]GAN52738.1 LysR family transcriptional regulator [Tanticharoenia sakaeratensis NBRC 103193]GBQ17878.1 LysR family transcriptional regulator [Tanticharoenia sakaeratensis NBRC 103193]
MTLEQLRIFVAVAEREHVTRASEALCLTQSATSHAVATLEAEFGVPLFSRVGRRIVLTEAGRLFLDEARAVLARAASAVERLSDFASLGSGTLHVHASHTIASYWLPARLNAFRARHPRIAIRVTIANTAAVCQAVRDGDASIGLIEGESADPVLESQMVATDRMLLVVAPDHPWATHPPHPSDWAACEWVLREPGSGTRAVFETASRAIGADPQALRIALELPSNEAVASAVETGPGATILSASVVAGRLEAGLLHVVPCMLPERRFALVRHRERVPSPSAIAFAALLKDAGP